MMRFVPIYTQQERGAAARPGRVPEQAPRALSLVLILTAAAVIAGIVIQTIAQHFAGAL